MSADAGPHDAVDVSDQPDHHELKVAPSLFSVDYRELDYTETVDRNLQCPICHCPFIDPSRLACDHTFCGRCVRLAFESQASPSKCCPSCRTETTDTEIRMPIPRFVLHMIDDLTVNCPRSAVGCDKVVRRGDVESHIRYYCDYAELPCPWADCNLGVMRKDIINDCLHQQISCTDCGVEVKKLDLKAGTTPDCFSSLQHLSDIPPRNILINSAMQLKSPVLIAQSQCLP